MRISIYQKGKNNYIFNKSTSSTTIFKYVQLINIITMFFKSLLKKSLLLLVLSLLVVVVLL
ncbi:MAG: NUMOD3 domain-containing DNA-binding protein [Candidatus Thorarchaeota archaeon]